MKTAIDFLHGKDSKELVSNVMGDASNCFVDWPKWWRGKGRHLLEGMPIIGTHRKVIRHVRRCLECRSEESFSSGWSQTGFSIDECRSVAEKIRKIVGVYVAWPNYFFLPEDRVAPLLGVIPGVWYDAEDPVEDVRKAFHLEWAEEGGDTYYSVVLDGKFLELFDVLISTNRKRV